MNPKQQKSMDGFSSKNAEIRLAIVTNMPVPYQVDLFNQLQQYGNFRLKVFYTRERSYGRHWDLPAYFQHDFVLTKEVRIYKHIYLSPGFLTALKIFNPDTIIVGQYASIAAQVAMYYASVRHIPWVFWAEAPYVKYAEHPIVKFKTLRKLGQSLALWPVRQYATQIWGIGSKAQRIYARLSPNKAVFNMPYFSNLQPYLNIRRTVRKDHLVRFLFAGTLSYRKGFDLVHQAAAILSTQGYPFEIHIAGRGPLENLLPEIPNSVYHGFVQPGKALIHLFEMCDVLLFPSRYDGWGLSVIEGLAAGMPVISGFDVGAAVDAIRPGKNGWILPVMNADMLAKWMRWFLSQPHTIPAMSYICRDSARPYDVLAGRKQFNQQIASIQLASSR